MGSNVVARTKVTKRPVRMLAASATEGWSCQSRTTRPTRKSMSASWRRIGKAAIISGTCHLSRLS